MAHVRSQIFPEMSNLNFYCGAMADPVTSSARSMPLSQRMGHNIAETRLAFTPCNIAGQQYLNLTKASITIYSSASPLWGCIQGAFPGAGLHLTQSTHTP